MRMSDDKDDLLIIVCNFSPKRLVDFKIGVPRFADYVPVFSSYEKDSESHAPLRPKPVGTGGMPFYIETDIEGYGAMIFRPFFRRGKSDQN